MDFLSGLNPQQQQAIMAGLGPVLVLAGPGSGKTRVLTHRIAYLISSMGVRSYNILAVTFTNKAAREMESRVAGLLGDATRGLTLGTFHSICARLLRREAEHLPFESNFVIFDSDDQLDLARRAIGDLNLDEKRYRPQGVLASISSAKNELVLPDEYPVQNYRDEVVVRVYRRYQELLLANNALDFDDLLLWTAYLLDQNPAVREKYARRFEHILVDEFQDTNLAQYALLKHLSSFHGNIFVVGDVDQCVPAGTSIHTPQGLKPVESIQVGECVVAAAGRGATMPAMVKQVGEREYEGDLVHIVTRQGFSFQATLNHIVFARLGVNPDVHYVYLMFRKDLGYRIGVVVGARSDGFKPDLDIGIKVRVNQEHADRIWILRVCVSREEANYWEMFYAFQFGIPTLVFHVVGRSMRFSQEYINRLYQNINTVERAECLLNDLGMDIRFPHYIPRSKLLRHAINLRYFADGRRSTATPWNAHRIDIWGSDSELKQSLETRGYRVRKGKRQTWRVGFSRLQFDDAQALAKELSLIGEDLCIVTGAFLVESGDSPLAPRFSLMPASHLHPSMFVAIERNGNIVQDEVIEVKRVPYQGKVYDLEVADVHNYLTNGVVVHNSIYRWRGADYRNVQRFEQDFPAAQVILLEQNYRSTQSILDVAMAVIDRNPFRTPKRLFTERGEGLKVHLHEAYDDRVEAAFVVDTLAGLVARERAQPGDFAVMYRTNAQSRLLEEAFLHAGLPYRLVGAQRFYGRREVKDIIAYLRLVHNPNDELSLTRIINVPPRGIGNKTFLGLRTYAQKLGLSPGAVLLSMGQGSESPDREAFAGRSGAALVNFGKLLGDWRLLSEEVPPLNLMDRILEDTGYQSYLDDGTEEGQERWENVMELRRLAAEYQEQGLEAFLEQVALVSDQDTLIADANVPTLLTLHAAKGLEFPGVFIVGLNDGTLPHSRSFDDPEAMQEERRLLYVGITRAKDRLYLIYSQNRSAYGYSEPAIPSRFIDDIPPQMFDGAQLQRPARSSRATYSRPERWQVSSPGSNARIVQQRFQPGVRVEHNVWGDGMVLNSRIQDDDEIVDIFFENVGLKRVAASLAKLVIKT